jgi:hypothetical protein
MTEMRSKVLVYIFSPMLFIGCATAPMRTPNVKNPSAMLPEQVLIEGIKIERGQAFRDCVPVALEAIFKFYGKNIDRKEIDQEIHKSWGTKTKDWIDYVKKQGFDVYSFYDRTQNKKDLKFFLAQRFPVLVIGGGLSWQSHIVILI